jgi:hypothetical protein
MQNQWEAYENLLKKSSIYQFFKILVIEIFSSDLHEFSMEKKLLHIQQLLHHRMKHYDINLGHPYSSRAFQQCQVWKEVPWFGKSPVTQTKQTQIIFMHTVTNIARVIGPGVNKLPN